MADVTITGLPNATTPLSGAERVPMDQAGTTVDATTASIAALASGTDLSYTAATRTLASSTGADVILPEATTSAAGLQSAADKTRIDQLGADDSPTFAGMTVTGTADLQHIHGNLAGEVYQHVRSDGVSLAALAPYHVTGSQGDTDRVLVIAARGDTVASMPASGILPAALNTNADGHGTVAGVITNVNTAGFASGDPVYVGSAGGLTTTRPTAGLVQVVAVVGRVHASTGTLAVAIGPALPPLAYTAEYTDVSNRLALSSSAPAALGATAAAGSSADAARADHVHQRDSDVIVVPVGDESTALTTGTNKVRFRMPFAATLLAVRANVNTAPTGSTLIVDINEAGTSVLGTKLSIDASETSSTTAASAATITDNALADDAEISIDIDQIGSTIAGAGLKVSLFVRRA